MNFETELINKIRQNNNYIGDDCAIFDNYVITTDALIEDVHFSLNYSSNYQIGYKTAAVSLSDIAAMGALPLYFLLSLALPKEKTHFAEDFISGFNDCLEKFNTKLIGGDTTGSKDRICINGTAIGRIQNNPILRKGANIGDNIYITKVPGSSAMGFELLKQNLPQLNIKAVNAHLTPEPEVEKALIISKNNLATAMQDVSDGISKDLSTICIESNCGAEIDLTLLPIPKCEHFSEKQLIEFALHGGEDYSLIFTSNKDLSLIKNLLNEVYPIGIINATKDITIKNKNHKNVLSNLTYNHF